MNRDETDCKQPEDATRVSEERYRSLFENNPHPMWVYDLETLAFLEVNDAAIAHYGYSRQEFLAMTIKDIHPPEVQPDLLAAVRGIPGSFRRPGVWPERKKDGTVIDVEIVTHDLLFEGRAARLVLADDITERKRTEEALRASQDRYRRIVETAREGIWIIDAGAKTTFVNQRMADMLGYTIGEMLYAPIHAFMDEQDYALVADLLERRRRGISEQHEFRFRRQDGTNLWAILEASPILDEHGKPAGTLAMVTDITDRKRAEEETRKLNRELERRNQELLAINRASRAMASTLDLDIVLQRVIGEVRNLLDAEGVSVLLQEGDELVFAASVGIGSEGLVGARMPASAGIAGWVLGTGEPVLVGDAQRDSRFYGGIDALTGLSTSHLLAAPLTIEGVTRGVIEAINKAGGAFDPNDLRVLESVAASAAIAVENARLYEAAQHELHERKRAEEALRRRAKELAALQATVLAITAPHELPVLLQTLVVQAAHLLNAASGGLYLCDPELRECRCVVSYHTPSDYTGTILRYGEGAAGKVAETGKPLTIDDYRTWSGRADVFEEEQPFAAVLSVPMLWQGNVTGVIHVLRAVEGAPFTDANLELLTLFANHAAIAVENARLFDTMQQEIAERKQAEEALRESEEKLVAQYKGIPIPTYTWQRVGEEFMLINFNNAAVAITQGKIADFVGIKAREMYGDMPDIPKELSRCFAEKISIEQEMLYHFKSTGESRHLAVKYAFVPPDLVLVHTEDITERKRAEEALWCSEERYRRLFEHAREAIIISDPDGRVIDVNPAAVTMLGRQRRQDMLGRLSVNVYANPEQRAAIFAELGAKGYAENFEVELIKQDGSGRHIFALGSSVLHKDEQGQILRAEAMLTDITERKRAEESLRKLSRAVEQSPALIVITDPNWVFEYVNPKFTQVTGYALEEVIGKTTSILQSGKTPPETYRQLQDTLAGGGEWRGEFCNKKKNGELYWESASISPLMNEDRVVTHFVAVKEDITERKRAEEALRRSRQLLDKTFVSLHDAVFIIDADTLEIIECNPVASKIFGYSRQEMLGRTTAFLHVDEAELDEFRSHLSSAVKERGFLDHLEFRMKRKNGSVFPTEHSATPFEDEQGRHIGWVSVVRDITERKRAEQALRESEKRYHIVSELTSDFAGAFRIALDGTIMREWLTGAYSRITGFNPGEMDTHGIWVTLVHPEDMRVALRHLQTLFSGQSDVCELRIVTASGEVRWLSNYGRPVWDEAQGRVIRIYSASQDITERKQAEERARREAARAKALARVAARLNTQLDLDTVLSAVCEGTAHALGVPVASVMLYEPDRQVFRLAGIYGLPPQVCEQLTPVPQSLYEEYREQKGSLIVTPDLQPSQPNVELYARYNIRTTVAASMVREEKLVGTLNVHTVGNVRTFDDDELALLQGLADQAALAIANAQLFEQVMQQREQLRTLTARLAETGEEQRRRLARELHDRVGQSLTALSINLNIIRSQLPADSAQATARLNDSLRLVEETIEHTRDVMAELRPPVLDDYGLLAALRWYAERFSGSAIVDTLVEGEELDPRLPQAVEASLFRIAQEALNNVTKHAHATQASVRLEAVADMAHLTIADNGVGFDPTAKRRPGELPYWGLITMKERAEAVGGRLRVESAPGQGTHITVKVPR